MGCPTCRRENPAGARFCNGCGAALPPRCTACDHENPPGAAFCNACGRPLEGPPRVAAPDPRSYTPRHLAERILQSRAAVEGERKHVTVLFCDVADSTPLAVRLGPEGMHAAMNRLIQLVCAEVHAYEGTVNQFLGDGTMALFGAPLALEDAPQRAVAAALGIQRAVARLAAEDPAGPCADLRVRIGIHSGPVVVGRIGDDLRMDYTAVGDTTHLAARLQGAALPGRVVLSEATRQLVAGWFELRELGALDLRGIANPVHAFEVVRERPVRDRVEARLESGLTPLVGRERELAALDAAFAAARAGRGQVAFVVGEAGLGKSRLLFEFRGRLADAPHAWLEGRCASYARATGFYPIADALRRAFRITDRDDEAAALAALEKVEAEEGGALAWTLPFLRQLLALPCGEPEVEQLDAATRRSETFRALRARIERAAARGPFVLVIEDLHWIDRASEELLAYLAEAVATLPALIVLTHRPGYQHPFGDRSYHSRIALQPLSEGEMRAMTGAVLEADSVPPGLGALIARKAEGNPFFVEEVAKSLLEEGALRRVERRVELARPLETGAVPDSIQDVLMARLDRLGEESKRALQVASIIGREFTVRLLERIHEAGERVHPLLAELRGLELIHEKAVQPELAFMFKHALTHDVAYASVL
ncbi:MAG TPA: AAA family ATPase, partial [Myxococcota bacterium]|nr:AAA family ATPase [Myxococcota bacterium]